MQTRHWFVTRTGHGRNTSYTVRGQDVTGWGSRIDLAIADWNRQFSRAKPKKAKKHKKKAGAS